MPKPFEIIYAPDQWVVSATSQALNYGGLHVQAPAHIIPSNYFPALLNIVLRNQEIRSRPAVVADISQPTGEGGNPVVIGGDLTSKINSLLGFSSGNIYQFGNLTSSAAAILTVESLTTYGWSDVSERGYHFFTTDFHTSAWQPSTSTATKDVAFLGSAAPPVYAAQTRFAASYLGILDSHLFLANVNEVTGVGNTVTNIPNRVRWSAAGFNPGNGLGTTGATFDPTISATAGFADMDEPVVTGQITLGRYAFIFGINAVYEMVPTGQAANPFDFNVLWRGPGSGNVFEKGVAQWGPFGVYIAADNVYKISDQGKEPIGGMSRDAIFADLTNLNSTSVLPVSASIVPNYIGRTVLQSEGPATYPYLTYCLLININSSIPSLNTVMWVYSFEDQNWVRWQFVAASNSIAPQVVGGSF